MSVDNVGESKKGQKLTNVILEWSLLQVHGELNHSYLWYQKVVVVAKDKNQQRHHNYRIIISTDHNESKSFGGLNFVRGHGSVHLMVHFIDVESNRHTLQAICQKVDKK